MLRFSRSAPVALSVVTLLACRPAETTDTSGRSARDVITSLSSFPAFAAHVGAAGHLTRTAAGYRLDGAHLGALLPATSDGALEIAKVSIHSPHTHKVTGQVVDGAVVFREVERDTDVIYVAEARRVEELRILRSANAPTRASYILRAAGAVRVREGRIEIVDDHGEVRLNTEPMFAVDARGVRRDLTVAMVDGRIETDLDTRGLTYPIVVDPVWTAAPSMATARRFPGVAGLPSGKLLVAGGGSASFAATATAEVFDPVARTWTTVDPMVTPRGWGHAHKLPSGKVLMVGDGLTEVASTELYDETTAKWTAGGSMVQARAEFSSITLATGGVLVAGGTIGNPIATAEVYDPTSNAWTAVTAMRDSRSIPSIALLKSGKVLVAGGKASGTVHSSVEIFDPIAKTWTPIASMAIARQGAVTAVLPDGRVLVAGGFNSESGSFTPFDSAEIYDPTTDKWTTTPTMKAKRVLPGVAVLSSGRVLLTGSGFLAPFLSSAEIYDPVAAAWSTAGTLTTPRGTHFSHTFSTGKVLIGGGYDGTLALPSTEEYTPLVASSACTSPGECASGVCADGFCCDRACDGVCEACDVAGKSGTCSPVIGAPHGARPACSTGAGDPCKAQTCGGTASTCVFAAAGTIPCGSATCAAGVETHVAKCDGAGLCGDTPKPCGAFKCGATACLTTCAGDVDCSAGSYCNAGACVTRVGLGEPCAAASACSTGLFCTDSVCCAVAACEAGSSCSAGPKKGSCAKLLGTKCGSPDECGAGSCVDGYCCDSACTGQCEACDVADKSGAFGKCTAVKDKPHGSRMACASDPKNPCSVTSCDGDTRTSCKGFVGGTVACRVQSCTDGTMTAPASCTGMGTCPEPVTSLCGGFRCDDAGVACKTSCTANTDCTGSNVCTAGLCRPRAGACSTDGSSLLAADGSTKSCAPYLCSKDECQTKCASSIECSAGNVCDGATCVPAPAASSESDGGCSYRRSGSRPGNVPLGGLMGLVGLAALAARRRRVRAQ